MTSCDKCGKLDVQICITANARGMPLAFDGCRQRMLSSYLRAKISSLVNLLNMSSSVSVALMVMSLNVNAAGSAECVILGLRAAMARSRISVANQLLAAVEVAIKARKTNLCVYLQ